MNDVLALFRLPWTWFATSVFCLSGAILLNEGRVMALLSMWAFASFLLCLTRINWKDIDA